MSVKQASDQSVHMSAHTANYRWTVGGTSGHAANSGCNLCSLRMDPNAPSVVSKRGYVNMR
jgi:hypothetical protein